MNCPYLNDSVEGTNSTSNKTDPKTRKHSPANATSIMKESGFGSHFSTKKHMESSLSSRNKMLKNKTLPNLFKYTAKSSGLINSSTRAITKQFMNPNRKVYNPKKNRTFIEPTTPGQEAVVKNRVYESGSTSRSGGTGEPNYVELKRRAREKNMYVSKINSLTKDNSKLKADYESLKQEMGKLDSCLETTKQTMTQQNSKINEITHLLSHKDDEIANMKKEFQKEREAESKVVREYINAENYLLELVDEFTNGMRKIYSNEIEFKDVDIEGLPFCERFSNLLYNILLIIDFQKQFIVEQSNSGNNSGANFYNNECIIEEADNEDGTENDGQNTDRKYEDSEGESDEDEDVLMKSNERELLRSSRHNLSSNRQSRESQLNSKRRSNQDGSGMDRNSMHKYGQNYENNKQQEIDNEYVKQCSSDTDTISEYNEEQEEPPINKTLVMLQKEMHKSLFSPSLMKINESPKISLLTDRSKKSSRKKGMSAEQYNFSGSKEPTVIINSNANNPFHKDSIPNIFGMNMRPSSGEVLSPTSEDSSRQSIRKDHLSKENRYQMHVDNSSENGSEENMSLESIVIKKENAHKYQKSANDSVEEAFTPNFITKRSSNGNIMVSEADKLESVIFYKHKEANPYDYRPPLVSVLDSEGNRFDDEDEFSESVEGSEQMFSSNREDVEENKSAFEFPGDSSK